eukprot:gene3187-4114_t
MRPMFHPRSHLHRLALWLALSGVLLRGLVPVGFMPGWAQASADGQRSWLTICAAGDLRALLPQAGAGHHHHAGMVMTAAGDADEHLAHRLDEADLSCPFAAADVPALPTSPASLSLVEGPPVASATVLPVRPSAGSIQRLPPV